MTDENTTLTFEEEEAREREEERKRKARQLKRTEAMNYFTAAHHDAVTQREKEEMKQRVQKLFSRFPKEKRPEIPKEYQAAKKLLAAAETARERKKACFTIKEDSPETKQLLEDMKVAGIDREDLPAIMYCSAGNDYTAFTDYLNTGRASVYVRNVCERASVDLQSNLRFYVSGFAKPLAVMLGDGLARSVNQFMEETNKEKLVQISAHIEDILNFMDKKPELRGQCGLPRDFLDKAEHAATLGMTIRDGVEALETLANNALYDDAPLSEDRAEELKSAVIRMSVALDAKGDLVKKKQEPAAQVGAPC